MKASTPATLPDLTAVTGEPAAINVARRVREEAAGKRSSSRADTSPGGPPHARRQAPKPGRLTGHPPLGTGAVVPPFAKRLDSSSVPAAHTVMLSAPGSAGAPARGAPRVVAGPGEA
jgi:hypothetical protein